MKPQRRNQEQGPTSGAEVAKFYRIRETNPRMLNNLPSLLKYEYDIKLVGT